MIATCVLRVCVRSLKYFGPDYIYKPFLSVNPLRLESILTSLFVKSMITNFRIYEKKCMIALFTFASIKKY